MIINEFFVEQYLTPGKTYDNFMFEDCPDEFLSLAKIKLSEPCGGVRSCVVCLDRKQESRVEGTLNQVEQELQKKVLARDFITALIFKELLNYLEQEKESIEFIEVQVNAFLNSDCEAVKQMHASSFMPHDVKRMAKELGKIELNFILDDTKNIYLQQAINLFISSREPYSVKIFTNNEKLATYYDLNGNIIECPHDFMRRDVGQFIEEWGCERC